MKELMFSINFSILMADISLRTDKIDSKAQIARLRSSELQRGTGQPQKFANTLNKKRLKWRFLRDYSII
ncbi:MAG: hypothetical protein ACYDH1_18755 [Anaerolineaceae bacterium]